MALEPRTAAPSWRLERLSPVRGAGRLPIVTRAPDTVPNPGWRQTPRRPILIRMDTEYVVGAGAVLSEGPVWWQGNLLWVDIERRRIHRGIPGTGIIGSGISRIDWAS